MRGPQPATMGPSTFLRNIYDLDTLDTRFTSSSSVPYHTVVESRSDPAARAESATKAQNRTQPPKWKTPEFFLYYVVFAIAVPYMFWVPYSVSRRTCYIADASHFQGTWELLGWDTRVP